MAEKRTAGIAGTSSLSPRPQKRSVATIVGTSSLAPRAPKPTVAAIRGTSRVEANLVVLKDISVQKVGYDDALDRLRNAITAADVHRVYTSVSEALNWLVSITDRSALGSDDDAKALRHARNRSHHQSASIVFVDKSGAWFWRLESQLPPPTNKRFDNASLKKMYAQRLEGQPLLDVFGRLASKVAKTKAN
jgi:hypothetical protein